MPDFIHIPQLEAIAKRHEKGESLTKLGDEFGFNAATLRNRLVEAGYLTPSGGNANPARTDQKVIEEVVARYLDGQSPDSIVEDMRAKGIRVYKHMVRQMLTLQGVPLRTETATPRKAIPGLEELAKRYTDGESSIRALADECGVSPPTLYKRLKEAGLIQGRAKAAGGEKRSSANRKRAARDEGELVLIEDMGALADRYRDGETLEVIADELGVDLEDLSVKIEIIHRYRDGDDRLKDILASIRWRTGLSISTSSAYRLLEDAGVPRRVREPRRKRSAPLEQGAHSEGVESVTDSSDLAEEIPDLEGIGTRWQEGRDPLPALAKEVGLSKYALRDCLVRSGFTPPGKVRRAGGPKGGRDESE